MDYRPAGVGQTVPLGSFGWAIWHGAYDAGNRLATSQIALPKDICDAVYATSGYEGSVRTLSGLSLNTDMVFRDDGAAHQLGTVGGTIDAGLTVALSVPVGT